MRNTLHPKIDDRFSFYKMIDCDRFSNEKFPQNHNTLYSSNIGYTNRPRHMQTTHIIIILLEITRRQHKANSVVICFAATAEAAAAAEANGNDVLHIYGPFLRLRLLYAAGFTVARYIFDCKFVAIQLKLCAF